MHIVRVQFEAHNFWGAISQMHTTAVHRFANYAPNTRVLICRGEKKYKSSFFAAHENTNLGLRTDHLNENNFLNNLCNPAACCEGCSEMSVISPYTQQPDMHPFSIMSFPPTQQPDMHPFSIISFPPTQQPDMHPFSIMSFPPTHSSQICIPSPLCRFPLHSSQICILLHYSMLST